MAKQIRFDIKLNVDGKEVVGSVVSDVKEMRKAWDDARSSLKKFADESFTLNQITESIQNITSAFNSLTEESRFFSVAIKAANTMAGKSGAEFEELTDKVKDLAKVIPLTRDELAKGLYQVISNGVPEDNWISYLEASSRAAVGGIANLEEVVKVTSTVIKNYGLD